MNPEIGQRLRAHPGFFGAMAVLLAVIVAAAIALGRERAAWQREGREVVRKQQELARLSVAAGGVTLGEVETLRADVARAQAELFGGARAEAAPTPVPTNRIEAYADLTAFVERQRAQAARAGVALVAEERFGFGQYAREGPVLEAVPEVWRQRIVVERVLGALWAARPQSLAGVWCEAEKPERDPAAGSSGFPAMGESLRCRLAFIGSTACLREYLTNLAGAAQPILVRELRAELLPMEARRPVSAGRTKFTLVLELLTVIGPAAAPVDEKVAPALVPSWLVPRAQSAGAGWRFEVFEPPIIEYVKERQNWVLTGGLVAAPPSGSTEPELIEVRPLPYRWRLVGHGGAGWIVLEDTRDGRTVRLHPGENDERGAITFVECRQVRAAGGEMAVEAQVRDRDGSERWLRAGAVAPGSELVAVLEGGAVGSRVEGIVGTTVRVGAIDYRIEAIVQEPASVEVTPLGEAGITMESRRLGPARR